MHQENHHHQEESLSDDVIDDHAELAGQCEADGEREELVEFIGAERCAELLRLAQGDDVRAASVAFRGLFGAFHDVVYSAAYTRVSNREDADDIVQEAYVRAWLHIKEVRNPRAFEYWLLSIVSHLCSDHWRKMYCVDDVQGPDAESRRTRPRNRSKRGTVSLEAERDGRATVDGVGCIGNDWAVDDADLAGRLIDDEEVALVNLALDRVPRRMRECVILHCIYKLKYDEVAAVLGIARGTVGWNITEGRARLLDALRAEWQAAGAPSEEVVSKLGGRKALKEGA